MAVLFIYDTDESRLRSFKVFYVISLQTMDSTWTQLRSALGPKNITVSDIFQGKVQHSDEGVSETSRYQIHPLISTLYQQTCQVKVSVMLFVILLAALS